jgi:hypothetical protein
VIINEQSMGGMASPQYLAGSVNKELQQMDPHTLMSIAQIGTSFIPFVGPFISAGIGLADAKMYYSEGDKKTAGITAALSMIPFVGSLISRYLPTNYSFHQHLKSCLNCHTHLLK